MMARLIGRERTLHATRRAPAHRPDLIGYTTTRDTIIFELTANSRWVRIR